jgi:methyl-accepting chemotaxis protein
MSERLDTNQSQRLTLGFVAFGVLMGGSGLVLLGQPGRVASIGVATVCFAAFGAAYGWMRRILSRLRSVSGELGQAAEQIATAAAQLAAASHSLARGIAQQSESVSEVSGSSELMASIMRQSADSGKQAAELMGSADILAAQVTEGLDAVVLGNRESSAAAAKIAGVTRVVDELAFQTNILALNAAVEAARAGESGAGFAVVADEVRNLAQRSAEAARDIATLVEESSVKAKEGSSKLDRVAEAMRSMIEQTGRVKGLVDELGISNDELVHGTDQISASMRQLDSVVQTAAASSEETAATGEEMSAQAAVMQDLIGSLQGIAGGERRTKWQAK